MGANEAKTFTLDSISIDLEVILKRGDIGSINIEKEFNIIYEKNFSKYSNNIINLAGNHE